MRIRKRTVTQKLIDTVRDFKAQNPDKTSEQISEFLLKYHYTERKLSASMISLILRVNTPEEYYKIQNEYKENERAKVAQAKEQENDCVTNDCEPEHSEESNSPAEDQPGVRLTLNVIDNNACDLLSELNKTVRGLLTAKGYNGYPDESIANKLSQLLASCNIFKKEMASKADIAREVTDSIVSELDEIKSMLGVNAEQAKRTNELLEKMIRIWDQNCGEI